jgi:hypothetical protein
MFTKSSRYANVSDATVTGADGREVRYKTTRFIPALPAQVGHIISRGERLDHIAYFYFRAPERFWRICDANEAMNPADLVAQIGRKIDIPESQS